MHGGLRLDRAVFFRPASRGRENLTCFMSFKVKSLVELDHRLQQFLRVANLLHHQRNVQRRPTGVLALW